MARRTTIICDGCGGPMTYGRNFVVIVKTHTEGHMRVEVRAQLAPSSLAAGTPQPELDLCDACTDDVVLVAAANVRMARELAKQAEATP